MRFIKSLFFGFLDSCLAWFTPSWRREAHGIANATRRYVNHYRPQLSDELITELQGKVKQLRRALRDWNKEDCQRLTQQLASQGDSLRGFKRSGIAEMVESFVVIMVVFLGIRTYYAQPFRIPTGSMQPSLNGIVVHPIDEVPAFPVRMWDMLTLGSSYVEETADSPKRIVGLQENRKWMFFVETKLQFDDGSSITIPSAPGAVLQYLKSQGKVYEGVGGYSFGSYRAGETIVRGRVDAGDMVIVNRLAYNFRHPKRGESFVFDTRGINTSGNSAGMNDQTGGTHYIKRLCGLPGDTLSITNRQLCIDGKPATEWQIERVAARQSPYNKEGYIPVQTRSYPMAHLTESKSFPLNASPNEPLLRQYAALGDNTTNSLDSRYWGPVHQYNVIGPAGFALWPFTSHWGLIP